MNKIEVAQYPELGFSRISSENVFIIDTEILNKDLQVRIRLDFKPHFGAKTKTGWVSSCMPKETALELLASLQAWKELNDIS